MNNPQQWASPPSPPGNSSSESFSEPPSFSPYPSSVSGSRRRNSNLALEQTTLSLANLSLPHNYPLPSPSPSFNTPTAPLSIPNQLSGILSPPTPAPSPTPTERWPVGFAPEEEVNDAHRMSAGWKGKEKDKEDDLDASAYDTSAHVSVNNTDASSSRVPLAPSNPNLAHVPSRSNSHLSASPSSSNLIRPASSASNSSSRLSRLMNRISIDRPLSPSRHGSRLVNLSFLPQRRSSSPHSDGLTIVAAIPESPKPTPRNRHALHMANLHSLSPIINAPLPSPPMESVAAHGFFFNHPLTNSPQEEVQPLLESFKNMTKTERFAFLHGLVGELRMNEALVVSRRIEPRLKRDFLRELPIEIALHCLSFVDEARTLGRAAQVSSYWRSLLEDEQTWKDMCSKHRFKAVVSPLQTFNSTSTVRRTGEREGEMRLGRSLRGLSPADKKRLSMPAGLGIDKRDGLPGIRKPSGNTYKDQFKAGYLTENNWLTGGRVISTHTSADDGVVTSLAIDESFIVIGMANANIHIFDAATGAHRRCLVGHESGVWCLVLVTPSPRRAPVPTSSFSKNMGDDLYGRKGSSKAQYAHRDPAGARRSSITGLDSWGQHHAGSSAAGSRTSLPNFGRPYGMPAGRKAKKMKQSDVCGSARGWGGKRPLVLSGGCDREIKVWDLLSGECKFSLRGHSSTIRCLKVLDGRPIAVSGSRDCSLRVWDIERGVLVHTLVGHHGSVRCIEIAGHMAVSGSYDNDARLWDLDTGECLQILRGHLHQIYAVAFDGEKVVTGSLDTSVRIWSAATGACLALLQGHTSLVGQLQLTGDILVTGGSDGRVIIFNLSTLECIHRLCAHDNSVTCLQFDDRHIVSGGNDGRVKLWNVKTGAFIRELTKPCDAVWRIAFREGRVVILCQRDLQTALEVLSFRADEVGGKKLKV
ncbi:F-box and WD-40 domain protein CDC4, partial [Tremellales sp. Uapishka_1]